MREPKRIWWARPKKLCALERPGGGGMSHRPERRKQEIAYLKNRGVRLVISSDAHSRHALGVLRWGVLVARRAWLRPEDVLNTRPFADFTAALRRHRVRP